jgi:peptidoglycan-associated lipoprotein
MKGRLSLAATLLGLTTLACLAGCDAPGLTSKKAKAPNQVAQVPIGNAQTTGASLDPLAGAQAPGIETTSLSVSDEIARACGIARPDGKAVAPSFDFDSAALGQDDRDMLAQVARCITEGALKGRSVMLVGRTDPRGEPEYNMNLGGSRADAVRRYMQDLGVGQNKLSTTSRGELDATGKDEDGWARDRRVDVQLVK